MTPLRTLPTLTFLAALLMLGLPRDAQAHCDALDGPVVTDARAALEAGDLAPVLKWIAEADEPDVRAAFAQTLAVRTLSPDAEALADRAFFETVVRLHRAAEGAPYTGLKPAGTDPGPSIRAADAALENGSLDELKALLLRDAERGLEERFEAARHALAHAGHNADAGRRFVHAYVEFVHFAERLHEDANTNAAHASATPDAHAH